jgi:hypothetical protein
LTTFENLRFSLRMRAARLHARPSTEPKSVACKRKFTAAEDALIKSMVARDPHPDWVHIASALDDRSARQCRERWRNYIKPVIDSRPWTAEEDQILTREFQNLGRQWNTIAVFLPGRTEVNVKNRWTKLRRVRLREKEIARNQSRVEERRAMRFEESDDSREEEEAPSSPRPFPGISEIVPNRGFPFGPAPQPPSWFLECFAPSGTARET